MRKHFVNVDWTIEPDSNGRIQTWQHVEVAVLMDIRDELQKLNTLLHCRNFQNIPRTLSRIDRRLSTTRKLTRGKKP